ncbi:Hsp70 family protein [Alkalimarinus coralli]|uniref:Hsp70 family protein n=1 Tax=Alkalimarinus coralli TaxID=2935863 RepID=UPI00202B3A3E|nr:Hsp70 family protein [Alkalimarinus coralli]
MTDKQPQYLIGIDLGTTNTVVAYADMQQPLSPDNCKIFEIEQLVAPGEVAKRPQLPSFRYHPTQGELNESDLVLPWSGSASSEPLSGELPQVVIGEWARELGAKVDGRQVVSAKSWLSHPQVDRSADILPWAGADDVAKVSPVLASSSYLFHVRNAWNFTHPEALIEHQEVVITVPASFDEGARALTVEAAERAGFGKILLLEEPQAVCYDWYARQGEQAQAALAKIKLLLVCDVGGGTTDLSLINVAQGKDGQLTLTRVGVGNHLMLGGDNVDLALAHVAERHINGGSSAKKLSAANLSQLIQQTRKAKELLLSEDAPESAKVTVLGSGARLIGGAKSCQLSQQEVRNIALDGFFPRSSFEERPLARRSGMVEFGLPYAPDPAVSKYLAEFIADHQEACKASMTQEADSGDDQAVIPDAVLFNGGVFNSPVLNERALSVLADWRGESVTMLDNSNPDLAVAQGAVAYAKARRGAQLKIGGGSARTFFLVLEQNESERQAICLMPKGTEEGQELTLSERKFLLRLGQPVQFHLLSSTADHQYQPGEILTITEENFAKQKFISLPPLVAVLEQAAMGKSEQDSVTVSLACSLTEVGTLQIDCVADSQQRWHVEFEIRKQLSNQRANQATAKLPAAFEKARERVEEVFGNSKKEANPKAVKTLRVDLEKMLGKRDSWEVPVLRALFDLLLEGKKRRRRSSAHERIWFNLAGYGLRPGFGYPIDDWRIEQVWDLYQPGLQFGQETQVWIDWWTFWRRAAGGLNAVQQASIYEDIAKYLKPSALTSRKLQAEVKQKSYEDIVKLVAVLEHLPVEDKTELTQWLLKRLEKPAETKTSWWAVGRIASRIPFHGSAHNVIAKDDVQQWLPQLLKIDWKKNQQAAFAAVLMTRMSGDRSRDVDDDWRKKVIDKLSAAKAPASWIEMVEMVKELDEAETKRVFGEGLPVGLKLIQ